MRKRDRIVDDEQEAVALAQREEIPASRWWLDKGV
jgi:hypothetical protein